jgi:aspartate-semialdehyde dehydrogenase
MDSDVPILIPEVNPEHLGLIKAQVSKGMGFIVTNSNCSTTGIVMGLKPLLNFGLKSVTVSTYQALSGAGRHGVASLDIIDNVIPYIKDEEEKIERETKKILGKVYTEGVKDAGLEVNASCCRVPTREGHLESIVVELEEDVDSETISRALSSYRGIPQDLKLPTAPEVPVIVRSEKNRPQPILDRDAGSPERAKGMAVVVGRIRKKGQKVGLFLLVHNTIRGAAGTCILSAELAVANQYIIFED